MNLQKNLSIKLFFLFSFVLFLTSCSAGDTQFSEQSPAGFFYGIWHGIISVISLIIHIFNDSVLVYEIKNTGGWYDCGFLIGVTSIWGGGCHMSCKSSANKKRDKEWEEIGDKVEIKVMHKLKDWAEDEDGSEKNTDWDDISEKVEKKLKRKIREWAEKD